MRWRLLVPVATLLATLTGLAGTLAGDPGARPSKPFFVGFASGGEHLVYATHRSGIRVLSVPGLEVVHTLTGRQDRRLMSVAVSGNGRWLAADYYNGEVWVWEVASGKVHQVLPKRKPKFRAVYLFHPHDDLLYLFRRREGLQRWDVASGQYLEEVRAVSEAERMALSSDGRFLAVAGTCELGNHLSELCVLDEDERLVVATGDLDYLFGETVAGARDLVFSDSLRLVAVADVIGIDRPFPVIELSPFDFRVLDRSWTQFDPDLDVGGVRSAPRGQLEASSADGRWKLTVSTTSRRLYLFRLEEGVPRLEKFAPLP